MRIWGIVQLATVILACTVTVAAFASEVTRTEVPANLAPTPHVTVTTPHITLKVPTVNGLKDKPTGSKSSGSNTGDTPTNTAKTKTVGTLAPPPVSGGAVTKSGTGVATETAAEIAAAQKAALAAKIQSIPATSTAGQPCEVGAPGCPEALATFVALVSAGTPVPCGFSSLLCPAPGAPPVTLCGSGGFLGVPCPGPLTPTEAAELANCAPGTYSTPACATLEAELAVSAGCPPGTAGTPTCTMIEAEQVYGAGCTGPTAAVACAIMSAEIAFTNAVLAEAQTLQGDLDNLNEISEPDSLDLQMVMDNSSTLLQSISNIEKANAATSSAVVRNLK